MKNVAIFSTRVFWEWKKLNQIIRVTKHAQDYLISWKFSLVCSGSYTPYYIINPLQFLSFILYFTFYIFHRFNERALSDCRRTLPGRWWTATRCALLKSLRGSTENPGREVWITLKSVRLRDTDWADRNPPVVSTDLWRHRWQKYEKSFS